MEPAIGSRVSSWVVRAAVLGVAATVSAGQAGPPGAGGCLALPGPGETPAVFAPGVVSTDAHEFSCTFTPDGKELYFTRRIVPRGATVIMQSRCVDGAWTTPEPAPFNAREGQMSFEPQVTPDGRRLYFSSDRPCPSAPPAGGMPALNTWYVEREGAGWGNPVDAGPPFNPMRTMFVSMTTAGTIYTTDISGGPGSEAIAVMRRAGDGYAAAERLGEPIARYRGMYPYIAPDESYMVFSHMRAGQPPGSSELVVTLRDKDGRWSEPRVVELGMRAGAACLSPDGRYLFFTGGERLKGDIYWVSASVLRR